MDLDGLGAFAAALTGFFVFLVIVLVAVYVLGALWESKALTKVGYDKPWMAWIPFANWVALADIAFGADVQEVQMDILKKPVPVWIFRFFMLLMVGVNVVLGWIPVLGSLTYVIDLLAYVMFIPPILRAIARKFNVTPNNGKLILDSLIQLIAFYDVYAWSQHNEFNPYADISDIVGSPQFDYSGFQNTNQQYGNPQYNNQPQQFGNPQYQQPQYGNQQYQQPQQPQYGNQQYQQPQQFNSQPEQFVPPVQEFDGSTFESKSSDYVNELKEQEGTDLPSEFM